jgi:VWFA-related protein
VATGQQDNQQQTCYDAFSAGVSLMVRHYSLLLASFLLSLSIPEAWQSTAQTSQQPEQSSVSTQTASPGQRPAATDTSAPPQTPAASQTSSPAQANTQQPKAEEQRNVVYESATVLRAVTRLVVVDVVATDGSGAPVTDLKADEFSIWENDKQQTIRGFSFQRPPASGVTAFQEKQVNLRPNEFTNVPAFRTETALNVLLLDGLNTNLANQAYARDQMIKYLDKIPEGQPIAIFLLSTKLRMLQDFTTDPRVLKDVIKNMKNPISPVLDNPGGGTQTELLPPGMADSGLIPADMLDAMQRFENERVSVQTDFRVKYTLEAMSSLTRMLSGYPGRKNLIWISEAFPLNINPDFTLTVGSFDSMRNYDAEIAETAEHMEDAQIAVYPIDARGLVTSSLFDASSSGRDRLGRSLSRNGRFGPALQQESAQLEAAHDAMQEIAQRTGGKAFYNRNDLDGAIRNSIQDGSIYYTLAYYPENKDWTGKFRKIHVKVSRSGVKLRYRLGYYAVDPTAFTRQNQKHQMEAFGQALNLDYPVSTALRFNAGVVQPSEQTRNKVLVNFGLDPHAITFEKDSNGLEHASVDCAVQAYTEKGKLVKTEASTINAQLKPDTFARVMRTIFPCQDYIDLPPGNYVLRLGVLDHTNSLMGTTNAKVTISAPTHSASN